jgi:hypothetical protein
LLWKQADFFAAHVLKTTFRYAPLRFQYVHLP